MKTVNNYKYIFDKDAGLFIYGLDDTLVFCLTPDKENYNIVDVWDEGGEIFVTKNTLDNYNVYRFNNGEFEFVREYVH